MQFLSVGSYRPRAAQIFYSTCRICGEIFIPTRRRTNHPVEASIHRSFGLIPSLFWPHSDYQWFSRSSHRVANMLKRQLLRQARACRGLRASPSSLLALGSGLAPRTAAACRPAVLTASISRQLIQRAYSNAAAAAESDNNGGNTTGLITRFADLSALGVHESLISAITQGMGYETMTDVQSMSINPALQGKDL